MWMQRKIKCKYKKSFLKLQIPYAALLQKIENSTAASLNDENVSFEILPSLWSVFSSDILNWKIVEFAKKRKEKLKVMGIKWLCYKKYCMTTITHDCEQMSFRCR